ncbi:TetR/AcrR family transcriptional regulator [Burkholderia sp. WSM2232]|uniref:TetR/AcrR family transcriptional regulator n=1 Tax=Burkholderia sp. WSM2232 TaxID=944436 RepID=UPI0004864951|nr:TetR/AcrR family transcriptional regulator [Burkholderia sp. WSM2232]
MIQAVTTRSRGRPRAFDEDQVLNRAIDLFSASGYSAAGISDLSQATGLTAGSLYKAYHDKEGIFAKALDRYITRREAEIAAMLEGAENGRAGIAALLSLYARLSQGKEGKLGCLMVAGIAELPQFSHAGDVLRGQLSRRQSALINLVVRGQADGSITTTSAPATVADLLLALLYGMRVLGKAGSFNGNADAFVAVALNILE